MFETRFGAAKGMGVTRSGTFGEGLKRLREEAGLTQEELVSRAGLTTKGISALERGERKRPYPTPCGRSRMLCV